MGGDHHLLGVLCVPTSSSIAVSELTEVRGQAKPIGSDRLGQALVSPRNHQENAGDILRARNLRENLRLPASSQAAALVGCSNPHETRVRLRTGCEPTGAVPTGRFVAYYRAELHR